MGRNFFIVFFLFPAAATPHYCWAREPAHHIPAQLPLHKLPNDHSGSKGPRCVSRALNHLLLASGWKKRNQPNSMEKTMTINSALPAAAKAKHWIVVNDLARGDCMQHSTGNPHTPAYTPHWVGHPTQVAWSSSTIALPSATEMWAEQTQNAVVAELNNI